MLSANGVSLDFGSERNRRRKAGHGEALDTGTAGRCHDWTQ